MHMPAQQAIITVMRPTLKSTSKDSPNPSRAIRLTKTGKALQILCFWLSRAAPIAAILVMTLLIHASVPAKAQIAPAHATLPIPEWECPVSGYVYGNLEPGWLFGYYRGGGWHRGIDIFGTEGDDLVATENGEVEGFWDETGGWSAFLRADSGNVYYYTHLKTDPRIDSKNEWPTQGEETLTKEDDVKGGWISAGARIGGMGKTGNARYGDVHLHFEFRQGGMRNNIDPLPYISKYCVG